MNSATFTGGRLVGRSVVRVAGPEARPFLHNLLTADIETLAPGMARYAALLTPQGKILFDVFVFDTGDGFLVDCAAARRDDLVKRLGFYRLRARVTIATEPELAVGAAPADPGLAQCYRDPRSADLGWRFFAYDDLPAAVGYDAARLALGLADSDADIGAAEVFPHEANLDQLGAVSFTKGCYIGQEVVSRMEHRGTARSRMLPVRLAGPAPGRGSEIRSGDRLVATLLSTAGGHGLALVRLDRLAEADQPLLTQGVSVEVLKPRWVGYDVANAGDMG